MWNKLNNFFAFSRRDRNGLLLFLLLAIAIISGNKIFVTYANEFPPEDSLFMIQVDSFLCELNRVTPSTPEKTVKSSATTYQKGITKIINREPEQKNEAHYDTLDINSADSSSLVLLPAIGPVFASRIIKYREMLGGYNSLSQLFEVYGFDSSRFATVSPYLFVNNTGIHQICVNTDDFRTVLHHPYISYEMTKMFFNNKRKEKYANWDDFKNRNNLPDSLSIQLKPYLKF